MIEGPRRILVVDDDPEIRFLHSRFLESFGYEVEAASDGIEGLAKIQLDIDLVLVDAEMPNMDGFEVARRIREDASHQDLPVVMVTGLARKEDRLRAYEVGINDFINKPVDPYELRLRLRWLLELKAAQDALKAHQAQLEKKVQRRTQALRSALEEMTEAKRRTYDAHLDTIRRLTLAAEYKDHDTAGHIERIGRYSEIVARAVGFPPMELEVIRHAAPMHDVGKIGIPDSVLLKPGPLDHEEREIMNRHTTIGGQILSGSDSPVLRMGEVIAMAHHEKWDGSGYPEGIAGAEIPVEARICTVVDFFDALTMDRPYRQAVPIPEVLKMMEEGAGTHFDPDFLDIFFRVRPEIEAIKAEYDGS
ncbi:MAG: HD domain-containing phosphohydrolase [Gemmatimonadota bacterium]